MSLPAWVADKEMLDKIELLASQGMQQQYIAACVGLHPHTLSEKKAEIPEVADALKKGKAQGIARVTQALLKNVDLGNVTAQIFYLKCQAEWKEAKEELNGKVESFLEKIMQKL